MTFMETLAFITYIVLGFNGVVFAIIILNYIKSERKNTNDNIRRRDNETEGS